MSDYISKPKLIERLGDQISHHGESIALVDKGVVLAYKLLRDKINLSEFDQGPEQGEAAGIGTEVLNSQLVDEVERHAKTAAENVVLRWEAARLREALKEVKKIVVESKGRVWTGVGICAVVDEALKGDTEPVGAQKVREMWSKPVPWHEDAYWKGITDTLYALCISISGINTGESQNEK